MATRPRHDLSSDKQRGREGARGKSKEQERAHRPRVVAGEVGSAGTESSSRQRRRDGELQSSGDAGEGDALEASSGGGGIADNALGRVGSGMNGL